MLQQTRVEAVIPYYQRFLRELPTIADLAACPEDRLLKLWEGLGYYSRVRNMQKAALVIMEHYDGRMPESGREIQALPGIGAYTAGAIASRVYGELLPAVDGNVLRVCTRLTASRADISLPAVKREVINALIPRFPAQGCGDFNQALMELGATICVPRGAPHCSACPLEAVCLSEKEELWREIPVLTPKKPRLREEIAVFLLRCGNKYALRKRPRSGLLAGLWEYPSFPGILTSQQALDQAAGWGCAPSALLRVREREHIFTHREWHMTGYEIECSEMSDLFIWATKAAQSEIYSLPSAFRKFLEDDC